MDTKMHNFEPQGMALRDCMCSRAFFLKQAIFRRTALSKYRRLMEVQRLSRHELAELNWERRKAIVKHAYEHVAYYRDKFQSCGFDPGQLRSPEDWGRVPMLTRADLSSDFNRLVADDADARKLTVSTTGGSTGEPVRVFHDRSCPQDVFSWRMLSWWGLAPGVNAAHSWRLTRTTASSRLLNAALWWPTKRVWLDATALNPQALNDFVVKFNASRPSLLQGYVGAIQELAEHCERNHTIIHSPAAIWLTAAPVSSVSRRVIESVFRTSVYDQYGSCEIPWLAAECQAHKGLHVFEDVRHVEFVNDAGGVCEAEELGKVVLTDLENRVFPLIRYVNGDMGAAKSSSCSCGLPFPLIHPVQGRVSDRIRMPDGTVLAGEYATTLFDAFPDAVTSFQVFQSADYSLTVRVVPNHGYVDSDQVIKRVVGDLKRKINDQVPVIALTVPSIESDRGKLRFVISEVRSGPVLNHRCE